MEGLNNLAYNGINTYFNTLSVLGYKKYSDVKRLLVLLFINDLLRSSFSLYVDEDDYRVIDNVLYCLFGSTCLIPYPEFNVNTSLVLNLNEDIPRISEDDILRLSEDEMLRLANR